MRLLGMMATSRSLLVSRYLVASALGASFGCVACASDNPSDRTFAQQVEAGGELYGVHCAECHGDSGQGTADAPRLVGDGALPKEPPAEREVRTNEFGTAADVFAFVDEYMPATAPDSVSRAEKVDILAFALSANGVELDAPLTLENAADVVLHE